MTYTELLYMLYEKHFDRVERDDRLLDVFPTDSREKGVELWEKWGDADVYVMRIRLPFDDKKLRLYVVARGQLEAMLRDNSPTALSDFQELAVGTDVLTELARVP